MENYLIKLTYILTGAILGSGGVMGLFFYMRKRKINFSEALFMEYKNTAQELAEVLKDVLPLSLNPQNYTEEQCDKIDNELANWFFKNYLVLPQSVLEEINCLHACLRDKKGGLYMIDRTHKHPILRQRKTETEITSLLGDVAIVRKKRSLSDIYRQYHKLPRYIYIKCQARHVITVLDREWNLKDMHIWSVRRKKQTLYMHENNIK